MNKIAIAIFLLLTGWVLGINQEKFNSQKSNFGCSEFGKEKNKELITIDNQGTHLKEIAFKLYENGKFSSGFAEGGGVPREDKIYLWLQKFEKNEDILNYKFFMRPDEAEEIIRVLTYSLKENNLQVSIHAPAWGATEENDFYLAMAEKGYEQITYTGSSNWFWQKRSKK